jgi:hypothetical protein
MRPLRARATARLSRSKAEPPEEVFRDMLLAGFDAVRGMEIDDVFPTHQTGGDEVHR